MSRHHGGAQLTCCGNQESPASESKSSWVLQMLEYLLHFWALQESVHGDSAYACCEFRVSA